jgi:uncharacterized protein
MTYWPWWAGGAAITSVMLAHWLATGRMMGVSGRYTALVDRARLGSSGADDDVDAADLIAAMRAATIAQFGEGAVGDAPAADAAAAMGKPAPTALDHLVFLGCLLAGGALAALTSGGFHPAPLLAGPGFARLTHGSALAGAAVLLAGGACVGFGTRMAGGCTSGHGMCGVSRLQKGSLLATVAFFGAGVAAAFALGMIR